ncbi:MAG: zinc ribbon domain-containing protein [Phycisphaerales bacterium]|jgi:hypothetical protein|nr:zinc ribbon domain-containing protein [Phycisphaerales bacterium]
MSDPAQSSGPRAQRPSAPGKRPVVIPTTDNLAPIPLAEPDAPHAEPAAQRRCPACSGVLAHDSRVCGHCGFNFAVGFAPGTGVGASATTSGRLACGNCGYSLKGLRSPVCPECGHHNRRPTWRRDPAEAARQQRLHYLVPLAKGLGGTAVGCVLLMLVGRATDIPAALTTVGLSMPLGVLLIALTYILYSGWGNSLHLVALEMFGIHGLMLPITLVLGVIGSLFPLGLVVAFVLGLMVYIGMLMQTLELDRNEALFVGLGVHIAAGMLISGLA